MNNIEDQIKRQRLFSLIKSFGEIYGEPTATLREYAKDVAALGKGYLLDEAIECFRQLNEQGQFLRRSIRCQDDTKNACPQATLKTPPRSMATPARQNRQNP